MSTQNPVIEVLTDEIPECHEGLPGHRGGRWKEVTIFDFEQLIANPDGMKTVAWPNEGVLENGVFRFNGEHQDFQPLLLDIQTLNLVQTIFKELTIETQAFFAKESNGSRIAFLKFVDRCWKCIK